MSALAESVGRDDLNPVTLPSWAHDRLGGRVDGLLVAVGRTGRPVYGLSIMRLVADVSGLPMAHRAVWRAYIEQSKRETLTPAVVADRVGCTDREVRYVIADLVAWGWLVCRHEARDRRAAVYEPVIPPEPTDDRVRSRHVDKPAVAAPLSEQGSVEPLALSEPRSVKGGQNGPLSEQGSALSSKRKQVPRETAAADASPALWIVHPARRPAIRPKRSRRVRR